MMPLGEDALAGLDIGRLFVIGNDGPHQLNFIFGGEVVHPHHLFWLAWGLGDLGGGRDGAVPGKVGVLPHVFVAFSDQFVHDVSVFKESLDDHINLSLRVKLGYLLSFDGFKVLGLGVHQLYSVVGVFHRLVYGDCFFWAGHCELRVSWFQLPLK